MRASRLVELLLRLQLHGGATAGELAEHFEVSVRTIYRDVEALGAAGVPVYTETGRHGGIRIDPSYRVAGLPRIGSEEARGVLFAVVPSVAAQLGFDAAAAHRTLLPAMDVTAERAARIVHERLLIEPSHWFVAPPAAPLLADIASGVWEARELRISYRGSPAVVQPLGLVVKGDRWYLLGRASVDGVMQTRLYRVSRIDGVEVLAHRFERPADFDLAAEWVQLRERFVGSLPVFVATVKVAPGAEPLLALLDEATPELPLPDDVERDEHGWAVLQLRFERQLPGVARHLLRLGAIIEVIDPPELRRHLGETARQLAELYR